MKRVFALLAVLALVLAIGVSAQAATPKQQLKAQKAKVAKLQAQLAKVKKDDAAKIAGLNAQVASLTGQVATLNGQVATVTGQLTAAGTASSTTIAGLNGTIAALNTKVTQQAQGGLAAVLAGNPTDLWNAVLAIWQVFPLQPPTEFCGFDKRNNVTGGTGLNFADYTFSNTTNC